MAMWQRFTDRGRKVVVIAQEEAHQAGAAEVGTEHLLLGLTREADCAAMKIMEKYGISPRRVQTELAKWVVPAAGKKAAGLEPGEKNLSERAKLALQQAYNEAREMNHNYVGTEHLLLGLLQGGERDPAAQTLRGFGLQLASVREEVQVIVSQRPQATPPADEDQVVKAMTDLGKQTLLGQLPSPIPPSPEPLPTPTLDEWGKDLATPAEGGLLGPLVGREDVVEQVEMILLRRRRRGACLVGPPGVGKMAVIREIQTRIVQRKVPEALQNLRLIVLDGARLAGDPGAKGSENLLWQLLHETMQSPQVLLVVEHLHLLFSDCCTEQTRQVAWTLLLGLVQQDFPCLGTCPPEEYECLAAEAPGFADAFRAVRVPEPTPELTRDILRAVRPVYESHHGVRFPDPLLARMVEFSAAQITPRHFPGKAIDLLDAAAARARQRAYAHLPEATRDLLQQLGEARRRQEEAVVQQAFEEAARLRDEVHRLEEELAQAKAEAGPIEVTEEDLRDVVRMEGGGNGREG